MGQSRVFIFCHILFQKKNTAQEENPKRSCEHLRTPSKNTFFLRKKEGKEDTAEGRWYTFFYLHKLFFVLLSSKKVKAFLRNILFPKRMFEKCFYGYTGGDPSMRQHR
jgi:hypothetical protein